MVCPAWKYVRERVREEEWMCFLMLVACPAASQWGSEERECALLCCWSVLLLAREEAKREWKWLALSFMLPGEVTRAEWHQSFSLDEICKFKTPTAKTIPALNNDLKFFLLHLKVSFFCYFEIVSLIPGRPRSYPDQIFLSLFHSLSQFIHSIAQFQTAFS